MAGREIKLSKGNELYDAGRRHVLAEKIQPLPDNLKKKISIIREAIPTRSKTEIAEVLQSCDYDVDRALNSFIAEGEMDTQNEWMVQGRRKNKKKKKTGKKVTTGGSESKTQDSSTENSNQDSTSLVQENNALVGQNGEDLGKRSQIHNGELPNGSQEQKGVVKKDSPPEQVKPLEEDELKCETTLSDTLSPPLLSPTESVNSLPDSASRGTVKAGHSLTEKQPRVRTQSTSGPEVIRKSLKDLQRSSVSIARFQSMVDEDRDKPLLSSSTAQPEAESSTKILTKTFQAVRQVLDEREKFLEEQLKAVIAETKKLLEERQVNAAGLKFKCNRVGTMSEDETTELRSEIKHFVGERRIDEDLGKTTRFVRDEKKMIEAVRNFGEVPPIKQHYTPYKRKHPGPVQSKSQSTKPGSSKATEASAATSSTSDGKTNQGKDESSNKAKEFSSQGNKQPVLSPSRLKDQAEMHARLQEALKHQVGNLSKDDKVDHTEKQTPKDTGGKTSRYFSGKQQPHETKRQHTPSKHRQDNSKNPSQNSSKVAGKNQEKAPSEEKKTQEKPSDKGQVEKEKKENNASSDTGKTGRGQGNYQQGGRKTRRHYIRRTPLDKNIGDSFFTNGNGNEKTAKEESSVQEPEDKKVEDFAKEQKEGQNSMVNGTNEFTPLPQRNPRGRKIYIKKNPGTEIKFPPDRENDSISSTAKAQPSVA